MNEACISPSLQCKNTKREVFRSNRSSGLVSVVVLTVSVKLNGNQFKSQHLLLGSTYHPANVSRQLLPDNWRSHQSLRSFVGLVKIFRQGLVLDAISTACEAKYPYLVTRVGFGHSFLVTFRNTCVLFSSWKPWIRPQREPFFRWTWRT